MAGQKDRFGIPFFYPTKSGGYFYESSDNIGSDDGIDLSSEEDTSGNVVTMNPNGPTSIGVGKNVQGFKDSIGGCKMSFKDADARGYTYKADDVRDLEFKCLMKINSIGGHGFSMSACTGHHASNSSPCCQGFAYMCTVESSTNPTEFRFRKEIWHVNYNDAPGGTFTDPAFNFELDGHGWFGYGFCRYNKKVGDETQVVLEVWGNPNPDSDITNWKMIKRIVDKPGFGWGKDGDQCKGDKDQVGTWSGAQNRLKTNATNGSINFKAITFREIDPSGGVVPPDGGPGGGIPGEPPPPPTTGTKSRDWILKFNVINFPQGTCGIASDTTELIKFYDVTDNGSSSNLHRDRYRVGIVANGSASDMIGKKPKRVILWLSKTGSPPEGDITVVLRKNNSDEVAVTYQYTGAASLNATDLTETKTQYTFENLTNIYAWQLGDRMMVEYSGNTSDTANDINIWRNTDNPFDGTATCAIKFDAGGPPPTSYTAPDTSRDYAWEMYE